MCHFHPENWGSHQLVQGYSDAIISNIAACIVHPSIIHADTAIVLDRGYFLIVICPLG